MKINGNKLEFDIDKYHIHIYLENMTIFIFDENNEVLREINVSRKITVSVLILIIKNAIFEIENK